MLRQRNAAKSFLLALPILVIACGVVLGKGKPPQDPPPDPDVLVEYQITFVGDLGSGDADILGINNAAIVVGRSWAATFEQRAFRWSQATGVKDLHTVGAAWVDMDTDE